MAEIPDYMIKPSEKIVSIRTGNTKQILIDHLKNQFLSVNKTSFTSTSISSESGFTLKISFEQFFLPIIVFSAFKAFILLTILFFKSRIITRLRRRRNRRPVYTDLTRGLFKCFF